MQEIYQVFSLEIPRINSILHKWVEDLPEYVRPIGDHVLGNGGKRLRPILTVLTARMLGCDDERVYTLAAAMESMHAATLLHDDILDNSLLRRGRPTAHTLFGTTQAILGGDAILAQAMQKVAGLGDTRFTACMAEAIVKTAAGEIAEISSLRSTEISHTAYLDIIRGKTAWMLRTACYVGALAAGASPERIDSAGRFGLDLGIAFQMVDDVLDFTPHDTTGKPMGGDLKEGKLTPPLMLYLKDLPEEEAARFKEKFTGAGFSDAEMDMISKAVHERGYAQKARELAGNFLADAATALENMPDNNERRLLRKTVDFIGSREL